MKRSFCGPIFMRMCLPLLELIGCFFIHEKKKKLWLHIQKKIECIILSKWSNSGSLELLVFSIIFCHKYINVFLFYKWGAQSDLSMGGGWRVDFHVGGTVKARTACEIYDYTTKYTGLLFSPASCPIHSTFCMKTSIESSGFPFSKCFMKILTMKQL